MSVRKPKPAPGPQEPPVAATEGVPEAQVPEAAPAAEKAQAVYTVQHWVPMFTVPEGSAATPDKRGAWVDVATVKVPAHTQRKTVIGRALAESGVRPEVGGEPLRVRVLDAASAHVTEVAAVQRAPELELR